MKIQKSFEDNRSKLYLVATPIGNLNEMTPRAVEILKSVDMIAAEDTRVTQKLLNHFEINNKMISYHKFNEKESTEGIINLLDQGMDVALVSDAGYPLISDPGEILVGACVNAGYSVIPVSGSSAFINALVVSGLVTQPFTFMGFLENKEGALRRQLESVKDLHHTLIFYLSVHRVEKTIGVMLEVLGNRNVSLARELTKRHEEIIRGTLKELSKAELTLKGEFVMVIEGKSEEVVVDYGHLFEVINDSIKGGMSPSRAIGMVAKEYKVSKNKLYNEYQRK